MNNNGYTMKEMFTMLSEKIDRLEKKFDAVIQAFKDDTQGKLVRLEDKINERDKDVWKALATKVNQKTFWTMVGIGVTLLIAIISTLSAKL